MKKLTTIFLSFILFVTAFVMVGGETYKANPALSMSVASSKVQIGDTVSVTVEVPKGYGAQVDIRFAADLLSYSEASTSNVNATNVANGQITLNMYEALGTSKVTVKFKSVSSGDATIEAVAVKAGDENGDPVQVAGVSKQITIANKVVVETPKSDDNSLASLKLSNGGKLLTLSPAFKYNVTNYTATVDYDVTSVVVDAKTSHPKATFTVTGNGTVSLKEGENVIEIVVKAENGYKVTYGIVVTRKAKPVVEENPGGNQGTTETETDTDISTDTDTGENTENRDPILVEGLDSGFVWDGVPLLYTEVIPTDAIPMDFAKETMMMNNVEIPYLNYQKGKLSVLYLKRADGAASLFVYDKTEESVYPFIQLKSNNRYVIILEPKDVTIPEGYEMCSFSIEGKGVVTGCSYTSASEASDFYLLYCYNNEGDRSWYQYDRLEGTFQRFSGRPVIEGGTDIETDTNIPVEDNNNRELAAKLKEEQDKNLKMICIFVFVVAVLVVVIFNLILTRKKDEISEEEESEEDIFEENESEDEDTEELESEELEAEELEADELEGKELEVDEIEADEIEIDEIEIKEIKIQDIVIEETKKEKIAEDKIGEEIGTAGNGQVEKDPLQELLEMELSKLSEQLVQETVQSETASDDDDEDFEFIDL